MAVSRPLHSGVCETRQDAGLPVIHSAISDSGRLRTRGGQLSWTDADAAGVCGVCVVCVYVCSHAHLAPASSNWRQWHRTGRPRSRHHHSGQLIACQSFAFY